MKKLFLATLCMIISNNLFTSQDSKGNFAVTVRSNIHNEKQSEVSEFVLIENESKWEIVTLGKDLDSIPDLAIFRQSVVKENSSKQEEELSFSCCSHFMSYLTTLLTSLKDSFTGDSHKKE